MTKQHNVSIEAKVKLIRILKNTVYLEFEILSSTFEQEIYQTGKNQAPTTSLSFKIKRNTDIKDIIAIDPDDFIKIEGIWKPKQNFKLLKIKKVDPNSIEKVLGECYENRKPRFA